MRRKKKLSNKKKLMRLKKILVVLLLILFIELIYVGYSVLFHHSLSLYFDGMNSIISKDSSYITVGSNNDNDYYYEKAKLTKYNLKREKTFEKLYNVGYNSAYFGVISDDDSIVAVGSYEKTQKEHNASIRRGLIVKYDLNGEEVFSKDFKLLDNTKFTSIVLVDDGYLVAGQSVYQSTKIGSKTGGAILLKYDKEGNILWYKTFGSNKTAIFNELIVVGESIYTVGMNEENLGIICQYNVNGDFVTSSQYQYTDEIGFNGVTYLENRLYVNGANHMNVDDTNAIIVEYDLDCVFQKEVIYENEGLTRFHKIIVDNHNNLVVIGVIATNKKTTDRRADNYNYDGIIGKYNSSLEKISVVTYGDDRDDFFTDILLDNNDYLVVGYSSYEDGSYLSKFIRYSDALKILGVE